MRFFLTGKPIIPFLNFFITTKCTLKCKNCNTFIPYYREENHLTHYSFDDFKKDLDIFLEAVDYINLFQFVGGEPLLNKDLPKMLEYASQKKQILNILIVTNATILPSEDLLNSAKKNSRIAFLVSDYRNTAPTYYDEIKKLFSKYGIKASYAQERQNATTWISLQEIKWDNKVEKEKIINLYKNCFNANCVSLCDGKMVQCTAALFFQRNFKLEKTVCDEIIDIRKDINLTKKIIEFYSKDYSEFCRYCHFENVVYNLPCGEQLTKEDNLPEFPYKNS